MAENSIGTYTRGTEVFSHYFFMFQTAALKHLFTSLLLGALIGFLTGFQTFEEEKAFIRGYAKVSAIGDIGVKAVGTYELPGRGKVSVPHDFAMKTYRNHFGGRSFRFIVYQVCARSLVFALGIAALWFAAVMAIGMGLSQKRRIRGAEIVDVATIKSTSFKEALVRSLVLGLGLGIVAMFLSARDVGPLSLIDARIAQAKISVFQDASGAPWAGTLKAGAFAQDTEVFNEALRGALGGTHPSDHTQFFALGFLLFMAIGLPILNLQARKDKGIRERKDDELQLGGIPIDRHGECYHWLFCGSPGSGKSTAIKDMLDQIRARGERAIVYDISGEYIEHYYRADKDRILNPLDGRHAAWNLFIDGRNESDFTSFARALFPTNEAGKNPFFNNASVSIFVELALHLKRSILDPCQDQNRKVLLAKQCADELFDLLLAGDATVLSKMLKGTKAANLIGPAAAETSANILASLASKLGAFTMIKSKPDDEVFSIRNWVLDENKDSWLFISSRQDMHETLRPLISLFCDVAASGILSLEPSSTRRVWVLFDEIASLQKLPSLPALLERGRKHGCAVMLGLQSMAQLKSSYGNNEAAALASQPQNWLVLRSVEPDTAQWLSNAIGAAEREEAQTSISMGANSERDGVNISRRKETKAIVLPSEIIHLPDMTGYILLPGDRPIYKTSYDYVKRPSIAEGFEPVD